MDANFQAVLFDLDGTLLDTLEDLADAVNIVLKRHNLPTHPLDNYRYFVGEGAERLMLKALPEGMRDEDNVNRFIRELLDEYGKNWDVKTKPYDGIPELLDGISDRGIKMAVLSNKPHKFTLASVIRFLNKWRFDVILGQMDSIPIKPDPTVALKIAQHLDTQPANFLYLGDTGIDMMTARFAGMFPVGALWGFRDAEELLENGAGILIKSPVDLLDLL